MSDIPVATQAAAPVQVLDAATATAQDQALKDQITALTARVTALEAGQPSPPQNTPSPDGTTVTTVGPAIIDSALRSLTIVAADASAKGQQVAVNAVRDTRTGNVAKLYAKGGTGFQQNTAGAWYSLDAGGNWAAASDPTGTTPVPPNPGTGSWTMSGGRLYRGGKLFVPYGPAVLDSMMDEVTPALIRQLFNGLSINCINLASGADGNGYASAQSFARTTAYVDALLAAGFVVMLSDYVPGQPAVRSGADLTGSCNWLGSLAKRYAGNDDIIWTTENEVQGDLNAAWQAMYDAVRNNGSTTPFFFEARCGNAGDLGGFNASILSGKTNVGVNIHIYPWEFNTASRNQADYDNATRGYVQKWRNWAGRSDLCVYMNEGGNSTAGSGTAPDDPIVNGVYAVTQSILNLTGRADGFCGSNPWLWSWHHQVSPGSGDADTLVINNALSNYGRQVNAFIAPTS